ncbi:MAG: LysE family translocator [Brevinematales bacterium]|nr:LysE family translocator [Brevinematales bacterium]
MMEILQIALIGLVSGITPGPLLTLAIAQTVAHHRNEGIKTQLAPLITDIPIAAVSILLLSGVAYSNIVLTVISFVGAGFIGYMAIRNFIPPKTEQIIDTKPKSLKKGIIANFLNPATYLFWITIGGPGLLQQAKDGIGWAILYVLVFYTANLGTAITVIFLADRFKGLTGSNGYKWILRVLGLFLLFFAGRLVWEGIHRITN